MELDLEPVKVDLQIETPSLERGAFYSLCFITENDEATRTLEVTNLSELLENGYVREDLAYNFCVGVFAQQTMESVIIRAKRSFESYEDAFSADSNDGYYYLVIESKEPQVVSDFNDFVVSSDDYKLQFYSSNDKPLEGKKLVHYFFDRGSDKDDFYLSKVMGEPDYFEPDPEEPDPEEPDPEEPELGDAFTFTTQFSEGSGRVFLTLFDVKKPWVFKDSLTGDILADSSDIVGNGIILHQSVDSTEITIEVYNLDSVKRTFSLTAESGAVSLGSYVGEGVNEANLVEVLSYYPLISNYNYRFKGVKLKVPNFLPKSVTSTADMFSGCDRFNQDLSSWDVSNVTDMSYMFGGADSFDQPLGMWDVSNVRDMEGMFSDSGMNQDISQWCVGNITSKPQNFDLSAPFQDNNEKLPQWGTCPPRVRLDPYDPNYTPVPRMMALNAVQEEELTPLQLQQQRLAYPEGAWIGLCGDYFPSRVNWLHKNLIKSDIRKINSSPKLPELSSTTMLVIKKRATVGSGLTTQGIVIHEQVSLDWIKWALGRKVWKTLYSNERINATTEGLELITNDVKDVLNLALEEEMLSEYRITEVLLDRHSNNLSLKFSCRLMETILFVDISGSLYY